MEAQDDRHMYEQKAKDSVRRETLEKHNILEQYAEKQLQIRNLNIKHTGELQKKDIEVTEAATENKLLKDLVHKLQDASKELALKLAEKIEAAKVIDESTQTDDSVIAIEADELRVSVLLAA